MYVSARISRQQQGIRKHRTLRETVELLEIVADGDQRCLKVRLWSSSRTARVGKGLHVTYCTIVRHDMHAGNAQIYVGKQNKHLLLQLQAFRRSPAKLK